MTTWFFPVADLPGQIVAEWINFLRTELRGLASSARTFEVAVVARLMIPSLQKPSLKSQAQ